MRAFPGHKKFVQCVAFSADGATLASASADHTVRLWDVASGEQVRVLKAHTEWATSVAFAPDGELLVSGSHDGHVRLWPLRGQKGLVGPGTLERIISSIAFAPSGEQFAWGSYTGAVGVCQAAQPAEMFTLKDKDEMIFCVEFAPNSGALAVGGRYPSVQLWDLSRKTVRRRLEHGDEEGCRSLAFSPNGRALALALGTGVQVWAPGTGELLEMLADHADIVSATAYSPDGQRLLTASWDGTVRLYDVDPGPGVPVRQRACLNWGLGKLFDVAFAPDGMTAACSGHDGDRVVVWDVE